MHLCFEIQEKALLFSTIYSTYTFLWCPKYSQLITALSSDTEVLTVPKARPTGGAGHRKERENVFFANLKHKKYTFLKTPTFST